MALVLSCLVITLVTAYSSAMMVQGLQEHRAVNRYSDLAVAFQLAESGVDQVITNLQDGNEDNIASTALNGGTYSAEIDDLGNGLYEITSHGIVGQTQRDIEVVASMSSFSFDYAVFAATTINMDRDARVDSYDSQLDAYGGSNVGTDGDVGSNATDASTITIGRDAYVGGDAAIGPDGDVDTGIVLGSGATLTGSQLSLTSEADLNAESYPGAGASGPLDLAASQEETRSGGTYDYTYVQLGQNAKVTFTGNATIHVDQYFSLDQNSQFVTDADCPDCTLTIYVNGEVSAPSTSNAVQIDQGSLVSAGGKPTQLTLYVTDTESSPGAVQLDANNGFYGAIHAPVSAVNLDQGVNVYGAIIAYSLQMDRSSQIHYDVALEGTGGSDGTVQLLSWREL